MTSNEMARIAYDALDEKLGEDIRIIQIDEISAVSYTHLTLPTIRLV